MKNYQFLRAALIVILATASAAASEVRDSYEMLVGCSVAYASDHRDTALRTLTATEFAVAAVSSCRRYANAMRETHYENLMATAMANLSKQQQDLHYADFAVDAQVRAESIAADAITRAREIVIRSLIESVE